jgi:hypothetical protein
LGTTHVHFLDQILVPVVEIGFGDLELVQVGLISIVVQRGPGRAAVETLPFTFSHVRRLLENVVFGLLREPLVSFGRVVWNYLEKDFDSCRENGRAKFKD